MKRPIFTILVLMLGLLQRAVCGALDQQPYRIDSWDVDDGLPQSSVLAIVQTHDGYLWLGTAGGLVRFDGAHFKVFRPNNTPGLPSGRILSLFEDRQRTLWIATEEGHLVRYAGGEFQVFSPPGWAKFGGYIQNFAEGNDGQVWLISPEKDVMRFPPGRVEPALANARSLNAKALFLTADSKGRIWTVGEREVGVWEGANYTRVIERPQSVEYSPGILVGSRAGGCWVAADGRLRKFSSKGCMVDFGAYPWTKGNVVCMAEDPLGQLWVGTYGSGVYCYGTNGVPRHFSVDEGLPSAFVRSMCEDREGNIWVGMEDNGLARIKPVVFQSYSRKQGLAGDCVSSVCEGPDGELWIGTVADGLDRLKDGKVQHFGTAQGLPNDYVHAVFVDRNRTLWVGTWAGGLCRLDGDRFMSATNLGATNGIVFALYQDCQNDLWIGQQWSKPEIMRLRKNCPIITPLHSSLSGTDIRAIGGDRDGNVWIGTQGDGLYRLKGRQQTRFSAKDGLGSDYIQSLFVDGNTLWIGTLGGGLSRFKDGKFSTFTTREGLPDDSLGFITDDGLGNLWCSSLAGVFRVSKADFDEYARGKIRLLRCLNFTKSDGLPSVECVPAGCKTSDGRLWFPTVRGLAVVDPRQIPVNQLPPPVAIEEVVMQGKQSKSLTDVAGSVASAQKPSEVIFPPGVQRLEFKYTGLSLTEPMKVNFRYILEGVDDDWVEARTRRSVDYSHLQHGNYRFRVQASNNDGIWNEQGAALAFVILPHVWQTWWFQALICAIAVLLFVAVYEMRLATERKFARERLRIAGDLHDEVGSNLGSIALLSEMIPLTAEEGDEIRRVALETVGSLRDIVWILDPAGDNLNDLILRMKDSAPTLLHGVPFQFDVEGDVDSARTSLHLRRNIFPMFKEILHNIAKHARATRVEIKVRAAARQLHLSIQDNGVGFEEAQVRPGNGLKNLRRRAAELKAQLMIQSRLGIGTVFILKVPLM